MSERTAEQVLESLREQFKKMDERNMRVVNAYHLYREVSRSVQAIKDKSSNISDLNRRRHFPLKREEIADFCCYIWKCLQSLDYTFFWLQAKSSIDELFDEDKIKQLQIQAVSETWTKDQENEISSFLMSLRFILSEGHELPVKEQRKIAGLKKRINNLQSRIVEELKYEHLNILGRQWEMNSLVRDAKPALGFNQFCSGTLGKGESGRASS